MRPLAHIESIAWKRPIEGADRIELVGVLGWQCIAKKDEFQVGDKCVYIEIDSVVDDTNPDFAFLEKRNYKIKTMKMRGVLSQGIVFPLAILHSTKAFNVGDNVTALLKIREVEDDVPNQKKDDGLTIWKQRHKRLSKNKFFLWLMRFQCFRKLAYKILIRQKRNKPFPDWVVKTDETRLQNMPFVLEQFKDVPMIVTEKIDGTSTTFALKKISRRRYDFAICSRNVRQPDLTPKTFDEGNLYHVIARRYNIESVLKDIMEKHDASMVVLQGETIGEGIQKNKYNLTGQDFYGFNLVIDGKKVDSTIAAEALKTYGIKWVPILEAEYKLLPTVEEMITYADGQSRLCDTLREGLVIRDHNNTVSFKCISNKFLLKHNL